MKNLLLNAAMLMLAANAIAQLYVQPNGVDESYVYVNDQVLFVEQDVNLVANPTGGGEEASIYLRSGSQLIQGSTASSNSGTGLISVFQDSNSDAYDYNFWGAPVGNPSLAASGNTNFGIMRMYDELGATDSDQTLTKLGYNGESTPLNISERWLYRQSAGDTWRRIRNLDNVGPGYGFSMKGTDVTPSGGPETQNQNYDFRGRPNNGTITLPTSAGDQMLAGNPYPSALDLNRVFYNTQAGDPDGTANDDNSEIDMFYYWDEDRTINSHYYIDNKGGYGTWIPMGSNPDGAAGVAGFNPGMYTVPTFLNYDQGGNPGSPSGGSGASYERRFAPVGQGLVIIGVASNGGDTSPNSIVFRNEHRRFIKEGAANYSEFRTQDTNEIDPDKFGDGGSSGTVVVDTGNPTTTVDNRIPHLRIYTMFGESHFRDMVLAFSEAATDGYDRGYDALHPMDGNITEAYWPVGEDNAREEYVIQTVPYEIGKRVPIAFNLEVQTPFSVTAAEEVNVPYPAAYLWDSETNIYRIISDNNTATVVLPAGEYDNRFFIVFRGLRESTENSEGTRAQEEAIASLDFFQNNRAGQLEVGNPEGYDIATANIFDMGGRLVASKVNLGSSRSFTFPTSNLTDGVYIVKLLTSDNFAIDHKITVFNSK